MNGCTIQTHGVRSGSDGGFSLMELLVVIAVITLLIAITLPSLGRAREQARRTECSTRLRNFAEYSLAMSVDRLDQLPDFHNDSGEWSGNLYVSKPNVHTFDIKARDFIVQDLGVERDFFYCPSNNGHLWNRDDFWTHGGGTSVFGYIYLAAAPIGHGQWTITKAGNGKPFADKVQDTPRHQVMWSDLNREIAPHSWGRFDVARGSNHFERGDPAGTNNAFLDGHVVWSSWNQMNVEMTRGGWKFWW